jgi:hypothetical protein
LIENLIEKIIIRTRKLPAPKGAGVSGNMPIVASSFKDCMFTDVGHTPANSK